jgi:acyl carrier protein
MPMSEQEILAGLADILAEISAVPPARVQPGSHLVDDLGVDSLSMFEIALAVQERFGVEIPDDMRSLRTIQDLIVFLQREHVANA